MNIKKSLILWMIYFTSVFTAHASTGNPPHWITEDSSGKVEIICRNDTMDIISPDGLTLWYNQNLKGDYEITYRVQVVMKNGIYDRLSDLNCFWGAHDPLYPDDIFARGSWRNGIFSHYNTLNLFYVGYGGNENSTTRFRRYHGKYYETDNDKLKPILKEYTDSSHLLKPNYWYEVKIKVANGVTTYHMDGEELFRHTVSAEMKNGYFAIRLWKNHIQMTGFKVTPEP